MMRHVYFVLSLILQGTYLLLPAASLAAFGLRGRPWLKRTIGGAWISGSILAAAILAAYVMGIGGSVAYTQIALTIYLGISLMLLLKAFDHGVRWAIFRAFSADKERGTRWRIAGAVLTRIVVLGTFALPWVMSAVMVFRPRVQPTDTPMSIMRTAYDDVSFPSRDGIRLAGWYVAAEKPSPVTVLLCHGLGANKAGMWSILKALHDNEINVLMIDLRAHGFSGGQLCTFGAKEPLDVLGAIDWLKLNHVDESHRIVAIGASLGGAAILQAAADDPRIDAVATIGTFDSLTTLSRDISNQHLVPPLNWLTRTFALPMASVHTGVNLNTVSPANAIDAVWPRPVLVIHGGNDEIIPMSHGQRLFDRAYSPRDALFTGGTHNGVMDDPDVTKRIVEFVVNARPVPII